ncbi:ABC transporter substrate-binding protein [Ilumatobacter nonamiensis]|uniref:ABC transporter substrate-binding protein n=1 Tax=Ilumatobacter nonamiensis TaxID=467093 RepID=UPI000344938A|nr:ABC transporter substrate-binding protein [Ilumatobacter nonamiensis]
MRSRLAPTALVALIALASCGGDDDTPSTSATAPGTDEATTVLDEPDMAFESGDEFPAERCTANEEAGTITYLTGFDFAAASSIIEVVTADAAGYYDDLCLDVEIRPGFSAANYPQVASDTAQFASGGSFSEIVAFAAANDANFVAVTVDGRSAIDTLIVKPGTATEFPELAGSTIGVKGKLPPAIDVMLRSDDLIEGEQYDTVLLDGFDPRAHMDIPAIDALTGWKSNEVGTLERAGVGFHQFDPLDYGVPGSFGVIFTSAEFVAAHPSAAQDFVRATLKGLDDAVNDPEAAALGAVDVLNANGNPNFLEPEGEIFRWETEAELILDGTPEGMGLAWPDLETLQAEVDAYSAVGLFGDEDAPDAGRYVSELAAGVYGDDAIVVWPG